MIKLVTNFSIYQQMYSLHISSVYKGDGIFDKIGLTLMEPGFFGTGDPALHLKK